MYYVPYHFKKGMVCQFQNGMVSPPATSEAGVHAAGDTKSEHFLPAGVGKLSAKQFSRFVRFSRILIEPGVRECQPTRFWTPLG
jgi:hypothetical protein